jgi:hypothetical protein
MNGLPTPDIGMARPCKKPGRRKCLPADESVTPEGVATMSRVRLAAGFVVMDSSQ